MIDGKNIQLDLIKLMSGERLFRRTESQSGLSLEKKETCREPEGKTSRRV